jgi:hypothetical protein
VPAQGLQHDGRALRESDQHGPVCADAAGMLQRPYTERHGVAASPILPMRSATMIETAVQDVRSPQTSLPGVATGASFRSKPRESL